ncbi:MULTISPECIES: thiol:disulfide interchange protein DsbA/DsbL [Deefgea]|uniref:Thiol:disulfide interchange protein n=1 Tax=Deefgea chitinilytica TaxID=570276 RepID=A0ABS2CE58_9NEIS|nr:MULTISPECIES: thiol:disulfide interchange protein DsbA/DsbL [Deefgea]MBM5572428.1 thioredoxin domain-containing protein [Deefgea chitinilytica]MBM9889664.1 thiol:disulfide interchange protein DsbA/DsbL [Deefgea sp. CFH1-16]
MLKNWIKTVVLAASLLSASSAFAFTEGKDFKALSKPMPVAVAGKQEVIEFFWYGCPHCYAVEPHVEAWAAKLPKDVNFRRVHVMWDGRNDMEGHAKIFLALQALGLDGKHQQAVMKAIQTDRIELRNEAKLLEWVKSQGIDVAKFKAVYNGFSTNAQLKNLAAMTRDYQIDGVPTFIVNGKWVTSPAMVGAEDATITKMLDELIAKGRKAPAAKKK